MVYPVCGPLALSTDRDLAPLKTARLYERPAAFAVASVPLCLILFSGLNPLPDYSKTGRDASTKKGHISKTTRFRKDGVGDLRLMKLDTFFIRYYSGTHSPSDYVTRFTSPTENQ